MHNSFIIIIELKGEKSAASHLPDLQPILLTHSTQWITAWLFFRGAVQPRSSVPRALFCCFSHTIQHKGKAPYTELFGSGLAATPLFGAVTSTCTLAAEHNAISFMLPQLWPLKVAYIMKHSGEDRLGY